MRLLRSSNLMVITGTGLACFAVSGCVSTTLELADGHPARSDSLSGRGTVATTAVKRDVSLFAVSRDMPERLGSPMGQMNMGTDGEAMADHDNDEAEPTPEGGEHDHQMPMPPKQP